MNGTLIQRRGRRRVPAPVLVVFFVFESRLRVSKVAGAGRMKATKAGAYTVTNLKEVFVCYCEDVLPDSMWHNTCSRYIYEAGCDR